MEENESRWSLLKFLLPGYLDYWLWKLHPMIYIGVPVLFVFVLFSIKVWKHQFPPVLDNNALSEAIYRYAREHFGASDLALEGEVRDIEITAVVLHSVEELEGRKSVRATIAGNYTLKRSGSRISEKAFRIKHRFDYTVQNGHYKITFNRKPGIKYYY